MQLKREKTVRLKRLISLAIVITTALLSSNCYSQVSDTISRVHHVTLRRTHLGNLKIDTLLLNSYGALSENITNFYLESRYQFLINKADFDSDEIIKAARNNSIPLMGGPMLGDLKEDAVTVWLRPANGSPITIKVIDINSDKETRYKLDTPVAGEDQRITLDGLSSATKYRYDLLVKDTKVAEGSFQTTPTKESKDQVRIAFGSCFHKIGLHNPNLANAILKRAPHAMLLLGDLAVDDRENSFSMHRSDYLLRDISRAWRDLAANLPLYTNWDDHDYLNNDLSGNPDWFPEEEKDKLRDLWRQNWNNPPNDLDGIYFNTRIGSVEVIMLDTRSCRTVEEKGKYGSYLGTKQLKWLKNILKNSTAPFKIISSGTMWSDYISNGKDSWGVWDTKAREEIFSMLEEDNIQGALLISGDRHGARGFKIPRESGFNLYEFEAASLGGVTGPEAMAKDSINQLFGYHGKDLKAFGEFTFSYEGEKPYVTFRLIDQFGSIMEEHSLSYDQLTPQK